LVEWSEVELLLPGEKPLRSVEGFKFNPLLLVTARRHCEEASVAGTIG
jgi:hypothetical protein